MISLTMQPPQSHPAQRVVFVQPVHDQHHRALKLVVSAYQLASEQRATARPAA
jgi:hypothetical protein